MNYLDIFDKAKLWIKYVHLLNKKYYKDNFVEIGAGIGSFTESYKKKIKNIYLTECDEKNLSDFATMGSALFKSLFETQKPRTALLNVGLEEIKGNDILKKTHSILKNNKMNNFEFSGYVEGNHIMDGDVDVIVTDGFTGNIALKTAEGTANFITENLKSSLNKLSILFSYNSLKKFKEKLDPRKYNGAIFLGLENPVV